MIKSSGEVTRAIKLKASECIHALAVEDRFTIGIARDVFIFLAVFHGIRGSSRFAKNY